ncbi:MAG: hypothetical protein ACLP8S_19255 [Solirubrobacteraceae bacterium]
MSAPESSDQHAGTIATVQDNPEAHPEDADIGTFADNDERIS